MSSPHFQPSDLIAAQAKSAVERIKEHPLHDIGETWKLFHQISSPIEPP
ncbi:hypothetical protein [Microcystis aeruginosa]|nr:hypothetical protein [Microcystis aeruginosa]